MRDIKQRDEFYEVSNEWEIYSIDYNHTWSRWRLKTFLNTDWYECVFLVKWWKKRKFQVHRMVAISFIDNPENKTEVNHKDWNRTNNNIDNLERVTHRENIRHSWEILWRKHNPKHIEAARNRFRTNNPRSKLNREQADELKYLRKNGWLLKDLSAKFNISVSQAWQIVNWKYFNY